jgi:bacillithiol system protein YtxJ
MNELEKFLTENKNNEILIFKFSPICGISRSVEREFKDFRIINNYPILEIDVINQRKLSSFTANYFNVIHESPQLIHLDSNHKVKKHFSHYGILDFLKE